MASVTFWDEQYSHWAYGARPEEEEQMAFDAALSYFGDVAGKTVLDLGCGTGKASLFFANHGAHVLAIDQSGVSTANLTAFCREHGIDRVQPIQADALRLDAIPKADFAFGYMILHHIEPFSQFVTSLRTAVKPGGRGFFYENNASPLLIWCRNHLVGRYGIPKYGDDEEFPLTPQEVDLLRQHFRVEVKYPHMMFFRLASMYLLKNRLTKPAMWLDNAAYKWPRMRRYSYRQYVMLG